MQAAIEIATYFGQHYLKMMCADNYDNSAQYLLEKITARIMRDGKTAISLRDCQKAQQRADRNCTREADSLQLF